MQFSIKLIGAKLQHAENGLEENTLVVWRNKMNTI